MDLSLEAIKAKKKSTSKLNSAVKRTERVLAYFSSVSEALKQCAFEVDELNEENNIRLAVAASMLDSVENLLNPDEPMDEFLFDRVNQFVDLIGNDMGMTAQQIDQLWELAKTL